MKQIPIGTMVVVEAPGGRGQEGETRMIPAIVLGQWQDGQVQLYALHFEGSFLMNAVPLERCRLVGQSEVIEKPRSFTVPGGPGMIGSKRDQPPQCRC